MGAVNIPNEFIFSENGYKYKKIITVSKVNTFNRKIDIFQEYMISCINIKRFNDIIHLHGII